MADFYWTWHAGTSGQAHADVIEVQYGNGYVQSGAVGDENVMRKWPWQVSNQPLAILQAIHAMLKGKGGWQTFTIRPPEDGADAHVICKDWDWTYGSGSIITGIHGLFEERRT